jgi:uncharacterized protein (TIGR02145 family)
VTFSTSQVTGATGYNWKGDVNGDGATKTTATTAGNYTAQSRAYVTTAGIICYGDWSPGATATIVAIPTVPAPPTQNGPKCAGTAITFSASELSGTTGLDWAGSNGITGTGTSKMTSATTAADDYTARVRSYLTNGTTTCYSEYSNATTGVIVAHPTLYLSDGAQDASATVSVTSLNIEYTAENAASVNLSSGSCPPGMQCGANGLVYTLSGIPNQAGTTYYTIATTNNNGCTNQSLKGVITVAENAESPPYAKTSTLTRIAKAGAGADQTWSDVINMPDCDKPTYAPGNNTSDCRNNDSYGYLYSYAYATTLGYASTVCPTPWRVPTTTDFCNLYMNLAAASTCPSAGDYSSNTTVRDNLIATWGGAYAGTCSYSGVLEGQNTTAVYRADDAYAIDGAYVFQFSSNGRVYAKAYALKTVGAQLRCVK